MLKDIMINLLITGGVWKVHDWLTKSKPHRIPAQRNTKPDWSAALTGCAIIVGIIFLFIVIGVLYMAVTDLPCFR